MDRIPYLCFMINEKAVKFSKLITTLSDKKIPEDVLKELSSWNFIIKSPYSDSFYNAPVGWNYKTDGSYRIGNHWNFESKGKLHCQTTTDITDTWAIGQYSAELNKYVIIKTFGPPTSRVRDTFTFQMLSLEYSRSKVLKHTMPKDVYKKCELGFLQKYFRILEEYFVDSRKFHTFTA